MTSLLYRFVDYNSGMYSSRNAAFQQRIATLSGESLAIDGDLLLYKDGSPISKISSTETAAIALLATASKPINAQQTRSDFKKKKLVILKTITYRAVNDMFASKFGRAYLCHYAKSCHFRAQA